MNKSATPPKRASKRGLTRLRNREDESRSRGAQVKEEENYLRMVDEDDITKSLRQMRHLLSPMGRRMSTEDTDSAMNMLRSDPSQPIILVPAVDILYLTFLDFFESLTSQYLVVRRCLFLETVIDTHRRTSRQITQGRVEDLQRDPSMESLFFSNEHCSNVHVELHQEETDEQRRTRATCEAVVWLQRLVERTTKRTNMTTMKTTTTTTTTKPPKLVLLTESQFVRDAALALGVQHVCGCHELLSLLESGSSSLESSLLVELRELVDVSLSNAREKEERMARELRRREKSQGGGRGGGEGAGNNDDDDDDEVVGWLSGGSHDDSLDDSVDLDVPIDYYGSSRLNSCLRRGLVHCGEYESDRFHFFEGWACDGIRLDQDGRVVAPGDTTTEIVHTKILLKGRGSVNRSMHGDKVAVRLVHRSLWQSPESRLSEGGGV